MEAVTEPLEDEIELLGKAQHGDRAAFEILLERCREKLERYASARIGSHLRSRIEPDDVLQQTYALAWESVPQLHWTGSDTFLRWLKGIARHVILRQADSHQREWIYLREDHWSRDPSPSPLRKLQREERLDRLRKALNDLPDDYREAIVLVRLSGLQIGEAARRMKRTPKSVMHLLARGLKKLRGTFGDTESLHLPDDRPGGVERGGA
jgi:RNA polymerase sigma-70 factor (ECF subfamily)